MALRIPFTGRSQPNVPPYGNTPDTVPTEQTLGHTPQFVDPGDVRPRVGAPPLGGSGRANFYGLPQWDELNAKLTGQRGLQIFDDMYWTDAHIRRLVLAAWAPLVAGTWTLEPYGGEEAKQSDKDIADAIWWMLSEWMSPNFTEHLLEVGPALLRFGFVPFEQQWADVKYQGKTLMGPRKLGFMLPRTIWKWWQDDYGDLTHIGQILPNKPQVVVPASELTYYRLAAEGDNWMGRSLLRHAYKHWYLKDKLERIDAIGQERKAVGVPVVYVSSDTPTQTREDIEAAVANMHVSEVAYMMMPGWKMGEAPVDGAGTGNQFLVDIIQFDSSSGEGIKGSIEYHQQAIAASFLQDFLELGHHQVGARATADVQEDPFLTAINGALLPPVVPPLDRLVDRIRKLNWASAEGSPQLKLTLHDEASLSEISAYIQQLVMAQAMQVDEDLEDWARERAGLPPANQQVRAQNQKIREAQQEATLAGAQASAQDPMGVQKAQALAAAKVPPDGDSEPPNPDKVANANAKPSAAKTSPTAKSGNQKPKPSKQLDQGDGPVAAGLIVHAADTGRVLMIQRTDDTHDDDDTRARWEFAGGKLDDGESPHDAGVREWQEETGATLPASASQLGSFTTPDGKYRAFGYRIPHEKALTLGRHDPDEVNAVKWWEPDRLHTDPRVRGKVQQMLPQVHQLLGRKTLDAGHPVANLTLLDAVADWENSDDPADRRICVDFDGVICDKNTNKPVHDPVTGLKAKDVLPKLAKDFEVVVFTANPDHDAVKDWLRSNGLGKFAGAVTSTKVPAQAYVDDNGVTFTTWAQVPEDVISQVRRGRNPVQPKHLDAPPDPKKPAAAGAGIPQEAPPSVTKSGPNGFSPESVTLDTATAGEPTAKWFERLLSQDRLREAFDGARDHIEASVGPAALLAARHMAHQAANGAMETTTLPQELTDALTSHYGDLYRLGHQTVQDELGKQRRALGKQLDATTDETAAEGVAVGARFKRARQRGEHSARNIANRVSEVLGRATITGLKDPAGLQTAAEQAAAGQLRAEAVMNAAPMVNDGRYDSAMSASDVVGAYYTSVLDERTCGECEKADTGTLLTPDEAVVLGPPNPLCAGSDRCRCALVWVLSSDPAALAAGEG